MPTLCFFFQAEDGIRDADVTGVQTCALPISFLFCGKRAYSANSSTLSSTSSAASSKASPASSISASASSATSSAFCSTEIGRASCRERVFHTVVVVPFKNKNRYVDDMIIDGE